MTLPADRDAPLNDVLARRIDSITAPYLRDLATRWKAAYRRGEWKAVTR